MEFGIKKCGILVLKRGKNVKMQGIVLTDGQVVKKIDESGFKYLCIMETSIEGKRDERPVLEGV